MSGMNSDQLHRSTLRIYSSLMDEFNPSLQKLVSLGNNYVKAFQALAVTSEAYFSALSEIGEKASHTTSSRSIGNVLIQISENQRRLTMELDRVFRWFSMEVIQEMNTNIRLDKDYISGSRKHYETEVYNQAAALERQLRKGGAIQDCSEYVQFLRESHSEALKEEERRYRFLSEKHCGLIQSFAQLMNKIGGSLQQRAEAWTEEVDATRDPESRRHTSANNYLEGWKIGMNNRPYMNPVSFNSSTLEGDIPTNSTDPHPTVITTGGSIWIGMVGMKREEEMRRSREELPLAKVPSRAPSPQGSISSSSGGRSMKALVAHQPSGSNSTLLPFTRGEIITVLVLQPKNGWLYGRADSNSRQGWFPATYVESMDDPPRTSSGSFSGSSLRSSSSMSSLLDQPGSSSHSGVAPPPPPPLSSNKKYEMPRITSTSGKRPGSFSEDKRSKPHGSQPELFPRGTNPFATVKLKPTFTDDRSAPRLYR